MIQKTIGLYNEHNSHSPFNKDRLMVEVCNQHVVCWVKSEVNEIITAFEFFKIEPDHNDWEDIFYELRINSGLIDKSYHSTQIYYHFDEVILVPAYKYNSAINDAFLNVVFGEAEKKTIKTNQLTINGEKVFSVFRIPEALENTIQRNFISITEHHIYNGIINGLLDSKINHEDSFIAIQFYYKHFIVAAFKNKQLQIIQSFDFTIAEDALYHILSITNKFGLTTSNHLLIGGIVEHSDLIFKYLQQQFKNIYVVNLSREQSNLEKLTTYPLHYFTPFFNLQA